MKYLMFVWSFLINPALYPYRTQTLQKIWWHQRLIGVSESEHRPNWRLTAQPHASAAYIADALHIANHQANSRVLDDLAPRPGGEQTPWE